MFIAWTTVADRETADRLAAEAVARSLAACVQVEGAVTSHYRWNGAQEKTEEFRLMFKALPEQLPMLSAWLHAHHPYETPEWIVVKAEQVGEKYLSWAARSLDT
ncbi:MAG: divalent-cation tolerance protein CutA [Opitutaceae bacterium]|jgi:periplasmic divalent cation tolerance protein